LNARGVGGEGNFRGRRTPFGQFKAFDISARGPGPFAPTATRRRQIPVAGAYEASPQIQMEAGFPPPQQVGQVAGAYPLDAQQGFLPANNMVGHPVSLQASGMGGHPVQAGNGGDGSRPGPRQQGAELGGLCLRKGGRGVMECREREE
jgi:hypothetical protein